MGDPRIKYPDLPLETFCHLLRQCPAQVRPRLAHGHQDTRDLEFGIDPAPDLRHRPQIVLQSHHRQKLRIHRDNDLISRRKRIDGQHSQRRAGINQNIIIFLPERIQDLRQDLFRSHFQPQLCVRHRQINRRRNKIYAVLCPDALLHGRKFFILYRCHHQMTDGIFQFPCIFNPITGRQIRLAVKIYSQHFLSLFPQRVCKVQGGGGFPHPAFL